MKPLNRVLDAVVNYLVLDRSLRVLLITSILTNLSGSLWTPLLGLYLTNNLGVSIILLGLMTTVQQLVLSLVVFPSGILSDNFGRKKMIVLSIIFSILSLTTLFFVNSLPWLFLVSVFQGLSMAFMEPSKSAYVIDAIPYERRGVAYATLSFFQSLSGIAATLVAGLIASVLGFYWLFGAALVLKFISLSGTALYLVESLNRNAVEKEPHKEPSYNQIKNSLFMLKNPPLLAVLFGILFHQLGLGIQNPYITVYANNILLFTLPSISLMLGSEQLGIFIGHFPSGRVVDTYGGEISFALHIFLTSPFMIMFAFCENFVLASLILFVWGLTFGLDNVSRQKLIAKYRLESGAATAFGVISLIAGLVSLVSPILGGWIWDNFSPQTVFYASAAVNVLGSLPLFMMWLYSRNNRKRKPTDYFTREP